MQYLTSYQHTNVTIQPLFRGSAVRLPRVRASEPLAPRASARAPTARRRMACTGFPHLSLLFIYFLCLFVSYVLLVVCLCTGFPQESPSGDARSWVAGAVAPAREFAWVWAGRGAHLAETGLHRGRFSARRGPERRPSEISPSRAFPRRDVNARTRSQ